MVTVEVAPIRRGAVLESLSFFSREAVPVGAVVRVSIRGSLTPALVLSVRDVREEKLSLRAAGFSLKPLSEGAPRAVLGAAFMRAAAALAKETLAPMGAVVHELAFVSVLNARAPEAARAEAPKTIPEVQALAAERDQRAAAYRNIAREALARGRSVILIAPTLADVERLGLLLSRGIEERVVVLHSGLGKAALQKAWERASGEQPVLVIGTPAALSTPRVDLDAIIVEREQARAYVRRTAARIDARRGAELVAREHGARLILADYPLRTETFARIGDGVEEIVRGGGISASPAQIVVVDARRKNADKKSFAPLTEETIARIGTSLESGRVAVYAARRGLAPMTVCNDCGTTVADEHGAPLALVRTPTGTIFRAPRTGRTRSAESACTTCGGWNLVTLGIGVDRVFDFLSALNIAPVFLLSADTAPTHSAAKRIAGDFYEAPRALLVGTERMVPYLGTVPLIVVASIDSTLSIASWRAGSEAHATLFALLAAAEQALIVETRKPDAAAIRSIQTKNPTEFLRTDAKERRSFGYPPFSTFITLSYVGSPDALKRNRERVLQTLIAFNPEPPLPAEAIGRGKFRERILLKIPRGEWPNERLAALIRSLPVHAVADADEIV